MKHRDTISQNYVMSFNESVRGLTVGAPVDFRGFTVGEVTDIKMEIDHRTKEVNMLVYIRNYPERFRSKTLGTLPALKNNESLINRLVEGGMRAQLKSGNLLTGQLYVALDFFPNAPKAKVDWASNPPKFPTTPGSMMELQAALEKVLKRVDELPLAEIAAEMRQAVQSLDTLLKSADTTSKRINAEVLPELKSALEEARKTLSAAKQTLSAEAPLQSDLRDTLRELSKAAQSLRILTDYLERNPEALIRGKEGDKP